MQPNSTDGRYVTFQGIFVYAKSLLGLTARWIVRTMNGISWLSASDSRGHIKGV